MCSKTWKITKFINSYEGDHFNEITFKRGGGGAGGGNRLNVTVFSQEPML